MVTATPFWEWSTTAAKDVLGVIGFALLASAVLFFLWCGFAYAVRKYKHTRDRPIARLFNPADLAVLPLDDSGLDKSMGAGVATLIRGHVSPRTVGGLQAVTGHTTVAESLTSLGEISDEAKAAAGIVAFFLSRLPNRHYEASGALQVAGPRGRGITVELNNRGDQLESRTLWADEFGELQEFKDDATAFQFLAIPAAAWIEHRLAARLHNNKGMPEDPEVWMLFNAGLDRQQGADNKQARWLYEKALIKDAYDSWSISNLGRIQLEDREYAKAEKSLTRALEGLETDGVGTPTRLNADWYRVKYNLAELHWEWWASLRNKRNADKVELETHRKAAHRLSEEAARAALEQVSLRAGETSKELRKLLEDAVLPGALILFGGTGNGCGTAGFDHKWTEDKREADQRALLAYLDKGLDDRAALAYVPVHSEPNPVVLFNLACAWAQNDQTETALETLGEALDLASEAKRKELVELAKKDPSFVPLQKSKVTKERFEKILAGRK